MVLQLKDPLEPFVKRLEFLLDSRFLSLGDTGKLGYDRPLYDRLLSMTDDMLGPSTMHIKYVSYLYDRFCI